MVLIFGIIAQLLAIYFLMSIKTEKVKMPAIEKARHVMTGFIGRNISHFFIPTVAITVGLYSGVVSAIYLFEQSMFENIGFTPFQISIIYMTETVLSALMYSLIEQISKKMGKLVSLFIFLLVGSIAGKV